MIPYKSVFLSILIPFAAYAATTGIHHTSGNISKPGTSFADTGANIIASNAKPKLISGQFKFTEGPAVNKNGDIFFTDITENKIWKFSTEGQLSLFLDQTGHSDGMYFDKKGNLITAADEKNEIWSISQDKKIKVLLDNYEGKRFNGPNDLWIDRKGGIYFTDPYYQRPYWERKKPDIDGQHVYYLPKGKKSAFIVDSNVVKPNGIIGSADGKNLFVADIGGQKTYKYDINKNGKLTNRRLFADMGSDGMTLDERGNLYLTGQGITVFNPEGKKIEHIPIPGWTANVCFGGKNREYLFITSNTSVYTLSMKVRGIR